MKKLVFILLLVFMTGCGSTDVKTVNLISSQEAKQKLEESENAIILDVRSREEYNEVHIKGAINMTANDLQKRFENEITKDKDTFILVYCKSGVRAKNAAIILMDLGYTNVYSLGGIDNWEYDLVK